MYHDAAQPLGLLTDDAKWILHNSRIFDLTYLYTSLLHAVRGRGDIAVTCSWTGISSSLLNNGRTVHSLFKLPVPMYHNSTSSLKL